MPSTLASNPVAGIAAGDTVLTCAERQLVSVHLEVGKAAIVRVRVDLHHGGSFHFLKAKVLAAGSHVIFSGIPLGVGDKLTIASDVDDTEFFVGRGEGHFEVIAD
jgi:hypothetical protein